MAENATTTTRVDSSSAGAVRRRPFPQLQSPPKPPTGIELNFLNMMDDLRDEGSAHNIVGVTDASDIEATADHLQAVLDPVVRYVRAVVGNLGYHANTKIPNETGFLADAVADIVGALKNTSDALAASDAA
jgi:hypothetical protein